MAGRLTLDITLQAGELMVTCLDLPDGVAEWNGLMRELHDLKMLGRVWEEDAVEPLVDIGMIMEGVRIEGRRMPGLNLSPVNMERCRFERCDLRGAELAICRRCSFRGSDLRGVIFGPFCDLTAADFTAANIDSSTIIERGRYDEGRLPKGLPERLLSQCGFYPPENNQPLIRARTLPLKVAARLIIPPR